MLPNALPSLSTEERRLLKCWRSLEADERRTLLAFAEFLQTRTGSDLSRERPQPQEPAPTPRPEQESVVAAIKRLAASYPMLDRDLMFDEISGLMSEHVLHGRGANEVIDALEAVFARQYQTYLCGFATSHEAQ